MLRAIDLDNERVDQVEGTHREFTLRGRIGDGETAREVLVRIDQSVVRTDYAVGLPRRPLAAGIAPG